MTDAVVFGVDFSPTIRHAIEWVSRYIVPGKPVVLVHAIDHPPLPGFLRDLVPPRLAAAEVEAPVLARLGLVAVHLGITKATCVARAGRADQVLLDVAKEQQAGLLVIGPHGVPMRPWRRVGTTAERLLRASDRSVLVARGRMPSSPPRRVLAAVDDVEITPRVLVHAGEIAEAHGAELHAVHVLSPAAYSHMASAEAAEAESDADLMHRIEKDLAEETLRWLRALWAATRRHGQLHAQVPHGVPADEILRVAGELPADLIVIGRYGIGRIIPAMLGSVVGSVVAGAECPVLVVAR